MQTIIIFPYKNICAVWYGNSLETPKTTLFVSKTVRDFAVATINEYFHLEIEFWQPSEINY
jgi:hypothetical protein